MTAGASGKGLLLQDNVVSKLIRTALSLRLGGWMRMFRRCMLVEIFTTLEVLEGEASAQAKQHRRMAMHMFSKIGATSRQTKAILACLPNGDWTLHDRVQVYVRPGAAWDRLSLAVLVSKALIDALAGSTFKVFNRNRWTNNDNAVNQFGLLESCHKLFSRSYMRWLSAVGYNGPFSNMLGADAGRADPAGPVPMAAFMLLEDAEEGGADGPEVVGEGAAGDGGGEGGGEAGGAAPAALAGLEIALPIAMPDGADFAAQNKQNRAVGAEWVLKGCPLRDLVLTRVSMEPSMAMLRRQLHMGSQRWDADEDKKLLGAGDGRRRDYRVLVCARGELDTRFAQHQQHLFWSSSLFSLVPPIARDESLSCLAFRMATRTGAEHERLMASRHRKPPFSLFMGTQSRQVASDLQELHSTKPCLLDSFSREFMDSYSLGSSDALAILRAIMACAHVDTSLIECWHAWTRRVCTRLGTQTNRPAHHDVFARNVAQRIKRRASASEIWVPQPQGEGVAASSSATDTAAEGDGSGGAPAASRKRGGGGAWRAHVSKRLRAGDTMTSMSASYAARSAEQVAADEGEGKAASARHHQGLPAFGPTKAEAERARVTNAAAVFNRVHSADPGGTFIGIANTTVEPALAECTAQNYKFLMRVVRKADFLLASEKKQMEKGWTMQPALSLPGKVQHCAIPLSGKSLRSATSKNIYALRRPTTKF